MVAKTTVQYREVHALRYGVKVVGRNAESGAVTRTVCLFCCHFRREVPPGKKRKNAAVIKYFDAPFRTDQYVQHMSSQHPTQWSKYRQSPDEIKRRFFPTDLTRPEPGKEKIENEKEVVEAAVAAKDSPVEKHCWFRISKSIVDLIVPLTTLVGVKGWQPSTFRACELVEPSKTQVEGVEQEKYYQIAIFNRMEMDIAVDSLAAGMSPTQVSSHLAALARRTTVAGGAAPVFPLLKAEEVREMARLAVSSSLQMTGELLSQSWCFGLVLREVTTAPMVGFLDVRVVVYGYGKLCNLHVVALPLFERHTAFTLAQVIENVLDAVFPQWRSRVLGISQDSCITGESDITVPACNRIFPEQSTSPSTHITADVFTLLERSILISTPRIPNRVLYKTWGACRQVSLILSSFYESVLGGSFLPALRTLTAYIRRTPVLLKEMGPPPNILANDKGDADISTATVDLPMNTEWLAMGRDTQWITDKRVRLRKYFEQQLSEGSSSISSISSEITAPVDDIWWVVFFVVHWVATRANESFEKLLSPRVSRSQQAHIIMEMSTELIAVFTIQSGQQPEGEEPSYKSRQSKFSTNKSNVHDFLYDQGMFVSNVAARLQPAVLDTVLENLAICVVNLAESLTDLIDSIPESGVDESATQLPLVLPHELAHLSGREFSSLLQCHGGQLNAAYSDEELDTIEREYQALCRAATHDTELKASLEQCNAESPFTKTWKLTKGKFPLLEVFAGGLASAFAGRDVDCEKSLSVGGEADIENDGMRLPILDFGLETTLHARQFDALSHVSSAILSTEARKS
ncbi:hypothetical protein PHMEG_00025925 [Phytophthora megakarya]|uniref:Uncharacterized protein n=1 Tax=Phytophthora megakarya TaxID=4795 RepID=A0A225VAG9_9STRA|nr:hypothetical protein PHMEG_00025925 [Phytophthora megakarya]